MLPEVVVDHFPGEASRRTTVQEEDDQHEQSQLEEDPDFDQQLQQFVEDPLLSQDDYLVNTAAATENREESMNPEILVPNTGIEDDA